MALPMPELEFKLMKSEQVIAELWIMLHSSSPPTAEERGRLISLIRALGLNLKVP